MGRESHTQPGRRWSLSPRIKGPKAPPASYVASSHRRIDIDIEIGIDASNHDTVKP